MKENGMTRRQVALGALAAIVGSFQKEANAQTASTLCMDIGATLNLGGACGLQFVEVRIGEKKHRWSAEEFYAALTENLP